MAGLRADVAVQSAVRVPREAGPRAPRPLPPVTARCHLWNPSGQELPAGVPATAHGSSELTRTKSWAARVLTYPGSVNLRKNGDARLSTIPVTVGSASERQKGERHATEERGPHDRAGGRPLGERGRGPCSDALAGSDPAAANQRGVARRLLPVSPIGQAGFEAVGAGAPGRTRLSGPAWRSSTGSSADADEEGGNAPPRRSPEQTGPDHRPGWSGRREPVSGTTAVRARHPAGAAAQQAERPAPGRAPCLPAPGAR